MNTELRNKIEQEADVRNPIKSGDDSISVTIPFKTLMETCRKEYAAGAEKMYSLMLEEVAKARSEGWDACKRRETQLMFSADAPPRLVITAPSKEEYLKAYGQDI